MNDEKRQFDEFNAQFELAVQNTNCGPFADSSSMWEELLNQRSNFPTYEEFKSFLSHDAAFAVGIGMIKALSTAEYETRYAAWVERYADMLTPEELGEWIEPDIGNPTIASSKGYQSSVIYIKNFALSRVVEQAVEEAQPSAKALKVLEIGAGYGGVAEILLRKGIAKTYTIVDLPQNLCLSANYLRLCHPALSSAVVNYADPQNALDADLRFLLPNDIELLDEEFDLIINTSSLGEMPTATAQAYVTWISKHLAPKGLFFSHNRDNASNRPDVVQKHSEFGFDKFSLAYAQPQPSPGGVMYDQHLVLGLTRKDAKFSAVNNRRLDQMSALVNMGLNVELRSLFESITREPTTAQQTTWAALDALKDAASLQHQSEILDIKTGDADCDNILKLLSAAIYLHQGDEQSTECLLSYVRAGRSPIALCIACLALANRDDFASNDSYQEAMNSALTRVPSFMVKQLDTVPMKFVMWRLIGLFIIDN